MGKKKSKKKVHLQENAADPFYMHILAWGESRNNPATQI